MKKGKEAPTNNSSTTANEKAFIKYIHHLLISQISSLILNTETLHLLTVHTL